MIRVTRLNGECIIINAGLIEFIESTPDTMISLMTGRKLRVQETIEKLIERVIEYERAIGIPGRCAYQIGILEQIERDEHAEDNG